MEKDRKYSFSEVLQILHRKLKKIGAKHSSQRDLTLEIIYDSDKHLSPEDIFDIAKNRHNAKSSLSSIYRILAFLEKEGFIDSLLIDADGSRRYELSHAFKLHHGHMICKECQKVIEFFDRDIDNLINEVAKKHGAKLISYDMKLFIVCKECLQKESL